MGHLSGTVGLERELMEYGDANPDFVESVVARLALVVPMAQLASRHKDRSDYEALVRHVPHQVEYERLHQGPRNPEPPSRAERVAAAWAEVEIRNGGRRRV